MIIWWQAPERVVTLTCSIPDNWHLISRRRVENYGGYLRKEDCECVSLIYRPISNSLPCWCLFWLCPQKGCGKRTASILWGSLIKTRVSQTTGLPQLVKATEVPEENIRCILNEFQWHQPINVYGITPSRCEYINTCDISELEVVLKCIQADWWESFAIELIDKPERMIPVTEVKSFRDKLQQLRLTQLDKTRVNYRQFVAVQNL